MEQKTEQKKYYPNVEYNRSKRNKFFVLMALLIVCMGLVVGAMVYTEQIMFAIFFIVIIVLMFSLIPSVLRNHPVKADVPELIVDNKDIIAQGKTLRAADIERVLVNVNVAPISKIDSENKEYLKDLAKAFPEEPVFGNVDIELKPGLKAKKGETIFLTIDDCMDALVSLVSAGVKHYVIGYSLKKHYEKAQFSITKNEMKKQPALSDLSAKERLKQLL